MVVVGGVMVIVGAVVRGVMVVVRAVVRGVMGVVAMRAVME